LRAVRPGMVECAHRLVWWKFPHRSGRVRRRGRRGSGCADGPRRGLDQAWAKTAAAFSNSLW